LLDEASGGDPRRENDSTRVSERSVAGAVSRRGPALLDPMPAQSLDLELVTFSANCSTLKADVDFFFVAAAF
jgi:hypothetical protein